MRKLQVGEPEPGHINPCEHGTQLRTCPLVLLIRRVKG